MFSVSDLAGFRWLKGFRGSKGFRRFKGSSTLSPKSQACKRSPGKGHRLGRVGEGIMPGTLVEWFVGS